MGRVLKDWHMFSRRNTHDECVGFGLESTVDQPLVKILEKNSHDPFKLL
ncbi:hypothetical protein P615_06370 [Brevibacillus laterosporus PE36]|nr:hypothetical protein P615_06370 [Brevibacillus laterosporus PE36]